jgi:hypothetical protein
LLNLILGWKLAKNANCIEPNSSNPDSTVGNWGKQFLRSSTGKEYKGLQNSANGSKIMFLDSIVRKTNVLK